MNSKFKNGIAVMAVVFGIMLSPVILSEEAEATGIRNVPMQITQGVLTSPSDDKPFGGNVVGSYYTHETNDRTTIHVGFDSKASEGTVYEGWLVDADSGEKTSFGKFGDNRQKQLFSTSVESNFNNDLIVITEEPRNDTDPAPATPVGGAVLVYPFGQ